MHSTAKPYIGYKEADYETDFARFFAAAPATPSHAQDALNQVFRPGILPALDGADALSAPGYMPLETGFTLEADGAAHIAVHTRMPGVSPRMWDWWFGWHGCEDRRYKLWHPKAHQSAHWLDGDRELAYIGRTSIISEYIGDSLEHAAIRFVPASELGFSTDATADKDAVVYICARLGYARYPIDYGWLVHQVRVTPEGAEMRSRFWLGGPYISLRYKGAFWRAISRLLQRNVRVSRKKAADLMLHCAEEMQHLAGFLPELYAIETIPSSR